MALIGKFRDTPFTDLIQFYASSRQTVAVTVSLPDGQGEDGVFYLEGGDVVDAWLGDAVGRDAVRRALRLADGSFRIEPNIHSAERTVAEPWKQVLLEETMNLDHQLRRERRASAGLTTPPPPALTRTPRPAVLGRQGAGLAGEAAARQAEPGAPPPRSTPLRAPGERGTPAGTLGLRRGPRRSRAVSFAIASIGILLAGAVVLGSRSTQGPAASARGAPGEGRAADTSLASAPTLTFGMVSPLVGPDKEVGRGMKTGVEIAFTAANEAGGVHGRKLALVALDDGNEPSRTVEAMRDLLDGRKVFAVVGNAGTATAAAALPAIMERKVPFVGALGGAALRKDPPDRYVFVYRPSLAEETAAAVRYLVEVRRIAPADIAVFSQADEFGEAGWAGAARQLRAYGLDPARVPRASYRRNSADIEEAAKRLLGVGRLKAVVMVAAQRPAARLIEKLVASMPGLVFTGVSAADLAQLAEDLAAARSPVAGNLVVTQVVPLLSSRSGAVMRYRALLEKHAQGEVPSAPSLEGWVVGTLLVEALGVAGPDPDPERLVAALESLRELDIGVGVKLGFSGEDHQASHKVWGAALDASGVWRQIDLE